MDANLCHVLWGAIVDDGRRYIALNCLCSSALAFGNTYHRAFVRLLDQDACRQAKDEQTVVGDLIFELEAEC